ncbi:MAG: SCP2 sterol-binding domain-containing protein, partial [Moraxellaceae bacterium]|nr:SCP2 sterol-binding domain-containing protein [Moraxellaceae bacterium]
SPVGASGVDTDITLADVFAGIKSYVAAKPELVGQTKTSFQFVFHTPESTWFIDLKNGEGSVGSGAVDKPDVTIELDTEHSDTLFGGDLAAVQKLYFGGKMKVHGNVMASNKLSVLSGMDKALVEAARKARVGVGASNQPAQAASDVDQGFTLADVFAGIKTFVASKPELVEQTKTSFQFRFHKPDSNWFIDLKNAPGSVGAGEAVKPDVTIELDAEHADTLFGGDLAAVQKLFFGGQMKVSGNVMASNKLSVLSSMDKSLVEAARTARLASGASAEQTASITTSARPSFAEQLMANLPQKPLSAGQCQGVMQLRVSAPESAWVINVSASGVSVTAGETDAETVVSVADEHLEALSRGERKLADLYQRGELTVDGDVSLARALDALVAQ